jgi:hypothetical protein
MKKGTKEKEKKVREKKERKTKDLVLGRVLDARVAGQEVGLCGGGAAAVEQGPAVLALDAGQLGRHGDHLAHLESIL